MNDVMSTIQNVIAIYGLKVIAAIIILVVGIWAAKLIRKIVNKVLTKRNVEATLVKFACNITYAVAIIFVIIFTLAKLGIQTASFVAVIGAVGLAIGLAMQGALGNFAAGVLIILFRPIKGGQFIDAGGVAGTVDEIQILYTQLITAENLRVIIPNGKLMSDTIKHYSLNDTRRAEWKIGVGYNDDLKKARGILQELLDSEERILKDPASSIFVVELADSAVNFSIRAWTASGDYWAVFTDMVEKIKDRFDQEGISIPFPQRDVHVFQKN